MVVLKLKQIVYPALPPAGTVRIDPAGQIEHCWRAWCQAAKIRPGDLFILNPGPLYWSPVAFLGRPFVVDGYLLSPKRNVNFVFSPTSLGEWHEIVSINCHE